MSVKTVYDQISTVRSSVAHTSRSLSILLRASPLQNSSLLFVHLSHHQQHLSPFPGKRSEQKYLLYFWLPLNCEYLHSTLTEVKPLPLQSTMMANILTAATETLLTEMIGFVHLVTFVESIRRSHCTDDMLWFYWGLYVGLLQSVITTAFLC